MCRRLLLWSTGVLSDSVQLRLQMSKGCLSADQVPVALLLPFCEEHCTNTVPAGIQVRPAGHVHTDALPVRDVCVVPGKAVVRQLSQRAVLPDHIVVPDLPGGAFLRRGGGDSGAVPGEQLLPARVILADEMPGQQSVWAGIQDGFAVRMSGVPTGAARRGRVALLLRCESID